MDVDWTKYVDPTWVTQPAQAYLSPDGMYVVVQLEPGDKWSLLRRDPDYTEDDIVAGADEWSYVGSASTRGGAEALIPP